MYKDNKVKYTYMDNLHYLQAKVLQELSRHPTRRFSDMMYVTGLTSDDFKFHLKRLVGLGFVVKNDDAVYELTVAGKELANRFDYDEGQPIRQPKLTTVVFIYRKNPQTNELEYLFQQRKRQPFFGYWGVIGEPIRWGEPFESAASRGLLEHTGLSDHLTFKGFYRQRDLDEETGTVFEDKLFVAFVSEWKGGAVKDWPYAINKWGTIGWIDAQEKRFDSCVSILNKLGDDKLWFDSNDSSYDLTTY